MTIKQAQFSFGCSDCGNWQDEGDPIYFGPSEPGERRVYLCAQCATMCGLVCESCGSQKQPKYKTCFDCFKSQPQPTTQYTRGRYRQ